MQAASSERTQMFCDFNHVHGQVISGKHTAFTHAEAPLKAAIDLEEWGSKKKKKRTKENPSTNRLQSPSGCPLWPIKFKGWNSLYESQMYEKDGGEKKTFEFKAEKNMEKDEGIRGKERKGKFIGGRVEHLAEHVKDVNRVPLIRAIPRRGLMRGEMETAWFQKTYIKINCFISTNKLWNNVHLSQGMLSFSLMSNTSPLPCAPTLPPGGIHLGYGGDKSSAVSPGLWASMLLLWDLAGIGQTGSPGEGPADKRNWCPRLYPSQTMGI